MVLFNYVIREITAKVVYYGPGLGGKTTNLQHIHATLDTASRGKLLSLATDGDRTLFFDFLPLELGNIGGYKVRFQLYTVPGQVHYNATRKLVLKGVDAVVFVADSQITMLERNRESYENLMENLAENGYEPAKIPIVVQLNKRDLPGIAGSDELVSSMGVRGLPVFAAVASRGDGVFETLRAIVKLTIGKLRSQFEAEAPLASAPAPSPVPPPPPSAGVFSAGAEAAEMEDETAFEGEPTRPPAETPAAPAAAADLMAEEISLEEEAATEAAAPARKDEAALTDEATAEELLEDHPQEIVLEQDLLPPESAGLDTDARRRAFFEEMEFGEWERNREEEPVEEPERQRPAAPRGSSGEVPPAWARELVEEVGRLRRSQEELRGVLGRLAEGMDRQIAALREAREAIAAAGAGAPPPAPGGEKADR